MKKLLVCVTLLLGCFCVVFAQSTDQNEQGDNDHHEFRLHSKTFANGAPQLPLSLVAGASLCPDNGGDQSPELSWENPPGGTKTFVVTMFDTTAAFTHWGMYNISRETRELPENAGIAGSTFGQQVFNDFFVGEEYDGPCPPPTIPPPNHKYVVTVYALDRDLDLTSPTNFPGVPNAEALYRAMFGHLLGTRASTGFSRAHNR